MRRHTTRVIGLVACVDTCREHTTRVTLVLPLPIPLGLLLVLLLLLPLLLVPLLLELLLLVLLLLVLLLLVRLLPGRWHRLLLACCFYRGDCTSHFPAATSVAFNEPPEPPQGSSTSPSSGGSWASASTRTPPVQVSAQSCSKVQPLHFPAVET